MAAKFSSTDRNGCATAKKYTSNELRIVFFSSVTCSSEIWLITYSETLNIFLGEEKIFWKREKKLNAKFLFRLCIGPVELMDIRSVLKNVLLRFILPFNVKSEVFTNPLSQISNVQFHVFENHFPIHLGLCEQKSERTV